MSFQSRLYIIMFWVFFAYCCRQHVWVKISSVIILININICLFCLSLLCPYRKDSSEADIASSPDTFYGKSKMPVGGFLVECCKWPLDLTRGRQSVKSVLTCSSLSDVIKVLLKLILNEWRQYPGICLYTNKCICESSIVLILWIQKCKLEACHLLSAHGHDK